MGVVDEEGNEEEGVDNKGDFVVILYYFCK